MLLKCCTPLENLDEIKLTGEPMLTAQRHIISTILLLSHRVNRISVLRFLTISLGKYCVAQRRLVSRSPCVQAVRRAPVESSAPIDLAAVLTGLPQTVGLHAVVLGARDLYDTLAAELWLNRG